MINHIHKTLNITLIETLPIQYDGNYYDDNDDKHHDTDSDDVVMTRALLQLVIHLRYRSKGNTFNVA